MNRVHIILWGQESGLISKEKCASEKTISQLEAFANLVVKHEREACAMVCETHAPTTTPTWVSYAAAIRARGNHA
jgi:hypothetical protein